MAWIETAAGPRYKIKSGDTLNKIAKTYLGDGNGGKKLYILQTQHDPTWAKKHNNTADLIFPGDVLVMPPEAIQRARELGQLPGGSASTTPPKLSIPSIPVFVAPTPTAPKPAEVPLNLKSPTLPPPPEPFFSLGTYVGAGAAGVSLAGLALLYRRWKGAQLGSRTRLR